MCPIVAPSPLQFYKKFILLPQITQGLEVWAAHHHHRYARE
jgi:hypothetical protein